MNILRLISLSLVTMVMIPMSVNAHCTESGIHSGDHKHCTRDPDPGGGGGKQGGGTYSAAISMDIDGTSGGDMWIGKPKGVDLNTFSGLTMTTITLDYFIDFFNGGNPTGPGTNCFGTPGVPQLLGQVIVKQGKKGRAEAMFWFSGLTNDGVATPVNYLISLTGTFNPDPPTSWPPDVDDPASMNMDKWESSVEGGGASLASKSCIDGPLGLNVDITITRDT